MLVCALVAHYAYRAYCREEHGASLPDLIVERNLNLTVLHVGGNAGCKYAACVLTGEANLIVAQATDVDIVSVLKDAYLLGSDVAKDTYGKTRSGERMTCDEVLGHAH